MEYRPLGTTGVEISEIGFGCGNTAGLMVAVASAEQRLAVRRAIELGINYFDTAPNYGERQGGRGTSETHLGQVLRDLGAGPLIGTKVEFRPEELDDIPGTVSRSVDESLKNLGVDHIDILYLHNRVGQRRTMAGSSIGSQLAVRDVLGASGVLEAFERSRIEGKVRFLGFCSSGGDVEANRRVVESGGFQVAQLTYNVLNPTEGMAPPPGFLDVDYGQTIDAAARHGMGVVVIRVLAAGALTSQPERHPLSRGSPQGDISYKTDLEQARSLLFMTEEGEQTMSQAAIRFALGKREVSTVLVGFSEVAQVEEAVVCSGCGGLPVRMVDRLGELYRTDFGRAQHSRGSR